MPPRPFHHWRSLWPGILILVVFGAAWIHSMYCGFYASMGIHNGYWQVTSAQGTVHLKYIPLGTSHGWFHTFQAGSFDSREHESSGWLPPAFQRRHVLPVTARSGMLKWIAAYWLLLLFFLIPWLAYLLWRQHLTRNRLAPMPFLKTEN